MTDKKLLKKADEFIKRMKELNKTLNVAEYSAANVTELENLLQLAKSFAIADEFDNPKIIDCYNEIKVCGLKSSKYADKDDYINIKFKAVLKQLRKVIEDIYYYEIFGFFSTTVHPEYVPEYNLPCKIYVGCMNGWQLEPVFTLDGGVKYENVIRFPNKNTNEFLCMKIGDLNQILDTGVTCKYSKEEIECIKKFVQKNYEIIILHNSGVLDSADFCSAIELKTQIATTQSTYRIRAKIIFDHYIWDLHVDMNDMPYEEAVRFYEKIAPNKEKPIEHKRYSFNIDLLEIEKPVIVIPQLNFKLEKMNKCVKSLTVKMAKHQNTTEICKNLKSLLDDYTKTWNQFKQQKFIYENDCCDDENSYEAAKENDRLKKLGQKKIKECYRDLENHPEIADRESISVLLWDIRNAIGRTMVFKLYALCSLYKEDDWDFIGFTETIRDAYYCIEHDSVSGLGHAHLLKEPSDEMTNSLLKIESEFFEETFEHDGKGPLFKSYKYTKGNGICTFCGKKIKGYGKNCHPVHYYHEMDFAYRRCCNECHEKYVIPAVKDENLQEKLRRQFLFERPEYEKK